MNRLAFAALLMTAGCAAVPRVDYHLLSDKPRSDAAVPYALTDTIVVIGAHGTAKPGSAGLTDSKGVAPVELGASAASCTSRSCDPGLVAVAVPTDFTGEYLAIETHSRHFVGTSIAPTYIGDSLRLRSLAVEVKDHRLEVINAFGTVVSGVVSLAAGATRNLVAEGAAKVPPMEPPPAVLNLPLVLDRADVDAAATPFPLPGNPGWKYRATFLDEPKKLGFLHRRELLDDARKRAAEHGRDEVHAALLTSVCRRLKIELIHPPATVVLVLAVADPDWLMTIPLPAKGAITPHALCGADVQPQPVTEIGVDEFATAFSKQVAAISAARPR